VTSNPCAHVQGGETYSSSDICSSVRRLLRDGDPVLAGADHSLVPNPLERALIQRLLHFCSGEISRESHNRHNVILDS
jgi:hypothetical protein